MSPEEEPSAPGLIVSSLRTFSLHQGLRISHVTCLCTHATLNHTSRLPYSDNGQSVKEGNEEQIVGGDHRGVNDGEAARKKSHGVMNLAPPTIRPSSDSSVVYQEATPLSPAKWIFPANEK